MLTDDELWFVKRFFGASDFYIAQFLNHFYRDTWEKTRLTTGEISQVKSDIVKEEKEKRGLLFW